MFGIAIIEFYEILLAHNIKLDDNENRIILDWIYPFFIGIEKSE